jgi:hypothetical protein
VNRWLRIALWNSRALALLGAWAVVHGIAAERWLLFALGLILVLTWVGEETRAGVERERQRRLVHSFTRAAQQEARAECLALVFAIRNKDEKAIELVLDKWSLGKAVVLAAMFSGMATAVWGEAADETLRRLALLNAADDLGDST